MQTPMTFAGMHRAVRRTLDLRNAPSTVLQYRKEAGWRMRRPLVARAKMGRAQCLPRRNLFQQDVRRCCLLSDWILS